MVIQYKPVGVCARAMTLEIEDDKIISVEIKGGCSGNSQGLACLLKGMDVDEAIVRMEGIQCDMKATSCPDQIARALKSLKQ